MNDFKYIMFLYRHLPICQTKQRTCSASLTSNQQEGLSLDACQVTVAQASLPLDVSEKKHLEV